MACPTITHKGSFLQETYQYKLPVFYLSHSLYVTKKRDGQLNGSLVIALRPGFFILQHSEKWMDKFFP